MRFIFFVLFSFLTICSYAQADTTNDVFALPITDYIVKANDTVTIVQVQMPDGYSLKEKQVAVLQPNYSNGKDDTAAIGWGRCQLIKGDFYYFSIKTKSGVRQPLKNDLIYTRLYYNPMLKGYIYNLTKYAIYLNRVTEEAFYHFGTAWLLSERMENSLLDSMVADIKYTAAEMLKQNDGQDQEITTGPYKGQRIFAAMQKSTVADLKKFFDYVMARPKKYAGNSWKVSEVYATWMVSGAPTVIKQ